MAKTKKVTTTVTTTVTEEVLPTNEKTQIICILDRSGSMASIMSDSIGGFNTFLKQQRELKDDATLTLALFDDRYDLLYDNVSIKSVPDITSKEWYPRGTTALYDAIGKTINTVRGNHAKLGNEKPSKVLVCIVTDGYENASSEYKLDGIKKLIKDCENQDWNFLYLAANQDAFAVGQSFGVSAGNTFNYTASGAGVVTMSATLNNATTKYRGVSVTSDNFAMYSKSLINDPNDANNTINVVPANGNTSTLNIDKNNNILDANGNIIGTVNPNTITYSSGDNLTFTTGTATAVPYDNSVIGGTVKATYTQPDSSDKK